MSTMSDAITGLSDMYNAAIDESDASRARISRRRPCKLSWNNEFIAHCFCAE